MKHKTFLRVLTLFLALLMIASTLALASCGGDGGKETADTKDTSAKDSGETDPGSDSGSESGDEPERPYLDDLNDTYNFHGETLNYVSRTGENDEIITDEDEYSDSDNVDVAVYTRQNEIEQRMNVMLSGSFGNSTSEVSNKVTSDAQSESNDFDYVIGHTKFNASLALDGSMADLQKISGLNLEKDYWNAKYTEGWSYKKATFWSTGDFTLSFLQELVGWFVNDEIFQEHYNGVNLFELVDNKQWTLDKATEFVASVYVDSDGDGLRTDKDTWGLIDTEGWTTGSVFYAAGLTITKPVSSAKRDFDLTNPHNLLVFDKMKKLYDTSRAGGFTDSERGADVFEMQNAMFYVDTLSRMPSYRDLSFKYSVLPCPMFDETQEDYITPFYDGVPCCGILSSAPKNKDANHVEAVGVVMEALAAAGKKYLTYEYYEVALESKFSKNEGTYKCLQTIRANAWTEFAFCWCMKLNQVDLLAHHTLYQGGDMQSAERQNLTQLSNSLKDLYAKLGKLIG